MAVEYLEKLVNFYPVSSRQDNVLRLLQFVQEHCKAAGLYAHILTYNGHHALYASTLNSKHSKVLLAAHVDVVAADNQPFRTVGDKVYGRGVKDMLFAVASYLQLLDDLRRDNIVADIALMLTGDEELGGENGVRALLEDGYSADVCILPDGGSGFGILDVASKGFFLMKIRINGRSHHGSRPWEGDSASSKLIRFLVAAEALFDPSAQDISTLTISTLAAGDAHNKGPATAEASLDIRYADQAELQRIRAAIDELLEKYDGEVLSVFNGLDYQLDFDNHHVKRFVEHYETYHGAPIVHMKSHGSSDARFFSQHGIPAIILAPDGGGMHGDDEWLSITSYEKYYALLKDYVLETAIIDSK